MLSRRRFLELSLAGSGAAVLGACAPTSQPAQPAAPAQPSGGTAAPATGGTLTPLWGQVLAHANPFIAVTVAQQQYFATVYSSLLAASPDKTKFDPELAEVTISPTGDSFTFKINPRAKFHDGRPVTAEDVAFTYTLALNNATKSNRVARLSIIKGGKDYTDGKAPSVAGIVVVDPQTIRFDMDFPTQLFLLEADLPILPKHLLGSVAPADIEKSPQMFDAPVGSGPYRAVRNLSGQFSETQFNPEFYRGRPKIDKMIFRIVTQSDAAAIALERGELDFTSNPSNFIIDPATLQRFLQQQNLFMVRLPNPVSTTLGFNLRLDHWKDKRVRQAVAYAVDRKRIIDSILNGNAEVVNTPLRQAWVQYKPKNDYAFNPDTARRLLSEARWDPNREVTVSALPIANDTERALRAAVQQQLLAVGFKTKWEELESSVWADKFYVQNNHDMVYIPASQFLDPSQFLDFHYKVGSRNGPGYASESFDALIERGRRATTQEARRQVYAQVGDLLNEDQPWVWLWSVADTYVFNRRVRIPFFPATTNPRSVAEVPIGTVTGNPISWFYRIEEWSVSS